MKSKKTYDKDFFVETNMELCNFIWSRWVIERQEVKNEIEKMYFWLEWEDAIKKNWKLFVTNWIEKKFKKRPSVINIVWAEDKPGLESIIMEMAMNLAQRKKEEDIENIHVGDMIADLYNHD